MKFKIQADTDDYLIILLLLIGAVIAGVGLYSVGADFVQWLSGSLSDIRIK